jgi:hypothetical protein
MAVVGPMLPKGAAVVGPMLPVLTVLLRSSSDEMYAYMKTVIRSAVDCSNRCFGSTAY